MRNGNSATNISIFIASFVSSYRTYEEWKRIEICVNDDGDYVLTVPMRNGNLLVYHRDLSVVRSSYRTYEEWKRKVKITVSNIARVLTVPMRNGNVGWCENRHESVSRSYRTYEEWKHVSSLSVVTGFHGSYRTYEEWKPFFLTPRELPSRLFLPYL